MCHLITLKSFQTCVSFFLMLNTKEDILKNIEEPLLGTEILRRSMWTNTFLIISILQNIFFYVQHKKETHAGLEWQHFHFWVKYHFNILFVHCCCSNFLIGHFHECLQAITVSEVVPAQSTLRRQTQTQLTSNTLPLRKQPGILHLRSCGDLSTFTRAHLQAGTGSHSRTNSRTGSRGGSRRMEQERPHSLIGVFRETVIWVTSQTELSWTSRHEGSEAFKVQIFHI